MQPSPNLLRLLVSFAVAAAVFGLLERGFAALPRRSIWRRARLTDFGYWVFTPFSVRLFGRATLFLAAAAAMLLVRHPPTAWFEGQPLALQALETMIAADLLGYATHRLFHRRPLWRFHAIHHSSQTLDWLAAARVHPVNEALTRILQFVPLYLLGFNGKAIAVAVPLLTAYAIFLHSNVRWDYGPLRYVVASPRFHRWHHTSEAEGRDRNFAGFFPWIDLLFGTFYMPVGREPEVFGVPDPVPAGLAAQLVWPFRAETPSGTSATGALNPPAVS
jgi:sterol desaturase/sphingolipid hydroxylase (fatty acid hydroxylase superfamily)